MLSEKGQLQHVGDWTGWDCFTMDATNATANSNIALGNDGPNAITAYIWDFGANNYAAGHRRWILYPQTRIMGSGDVPVQVSAQETNNSANATWVFDANYGGPRPATRTPNVTWPPAGFVPYQVVFPQWSFALSNANLSAAAVSMTSNGVAVPITQQSYVTGYGENTLVWYPTALDWTSETSFPFGGTDTVYTITVSNVATPGGTETFTYHVTVFDPATTDTNYSALIITGTDHPGINASNSYSCTAAANPNLTGYQWLTAQSTNGNSLDNGLNGTTNFTVSPTPTYPIVTNPPAGSGKCFHLAHVNAASEMLELNELLFPTNTTTVGFKSLLGYADASEVARVQISTDEGSTWQDIYKQAGSGSAGETAFTQHTLPLGGYAGKSVRVRFDYDFSTGSYFPQNSPNVGWCLEGIAITNAQQLVNQSINSTTSTNFVFTPAAAGNYVLQARGVIFNEFPIDFGPGRLVSAIVGAPVITLSGITVSGGQVKITFAIASGTASTFHLLEANEAGGVWSTNGSAVLTTNGAAGPFQFVTTNGPAVRFYRVQTP
jgi:hypothetical protein